MEGPGGRVGFDAFVEGLCQRFYHDEIGRPSIPPGVYFRMLLIGYFEGIDSERGIAWRCDDSRTLRDFLGYSMTEGTPDHSSLSVIRRRMDVETHQEVFAWVLKVLAERGLLQGKTLGIDATTLEANAAMRSIVRNDGGQTYNEFLRKLAKAGGIETPTREDLARIDQTRKNKASNDERDAVYANRRRIRGDRGKRLLRKRGELLERPFAHCYETGAMRRTHLRGHPNILKRLRVHVAGFNLALVMRSLLGLGKPRRLQDGLGALLKSSLGAVFGLIMVLLATIRPLRTPGDRFRRLWPAQRPETAPRAAA